MVNIYISIKNSLIAVLRELFPGFDVFTEEISKTDESDDDLDINNYFFIDIMPVNSETVNKYHSERNLLIDIACHTASEKNEDYLMIADEIDSNIRPVFRFEDRAITINRANFQISDKVLHYNFNLIFVDTVDEVSEYPIMEELETNERM